MCCRGFESVKVCTAYRADGDAVRRRAVAPVALPRRGARLRGARGLGRGSRRRCARSPSFPRRRGSTSTGCRIWPACRSASCRSVPAGSRVFPPTRRATRTTHEGARRGRRRARARDRLAPRRRIRRSTGCSPRRATPGIARDAHCVAVAADDVPAIVDLVERERIDLTVIGPEAPLVAGLADELDARGHLVFGPTRAAARIEGSKAWAKGSASATGSRRRGRRPSARCRRRSPPSTVRAAVRRQGRRARRRQGRA